MRLAPGDPPTSPGPRDPSSKIRVPVPARLSGRGDTPCRFREIGGSRRYGWSWPEPPAGATPHQRREPRALAGTGDLRAAGVTNGQSDGGATEPFH